MFSFLIFKKCIGSTPVPMVIVLGIKQVDTGYPEAGFFATLSLVLSALLSLYSLYLNSSLKRTLAYRDSMWARV